MRTFADLRAGEQIHGRAADERGDQRADGVIVEQPRRVELNESATIEHRDPLTQAQRLALVVGDVDQRRPEYFMQFDQLATERGAEREVEA